METPLEALLFRRRTAKVLGDPAAPMPVREPGIPVERLLAAAGTAPFHHVSGPDVPEPWRVHILDGSGCRTLANQMVAHPEAGKIPAMLASADQLAYITWRPVGAFSRGRKPSFQGTFVNMEHVAATAAFIQNILLLATEEGVDSYWSSGGLLAEPEGYARLGVPDDELLLGAVFLFPGDAPPEHRVTGKHRDKRTSWHEWTRNVQIDDVS